MSVVWEINGTLIVTMVINIVIVVAFSVRSSDRSTLAMREVELLKERLDLMQVQTAAHREMVAERMVSREILREVEDRISAALDKLGDRLDGFTKRLLDERRPSQR